MHAHTGLGRPACSRSDGPLDHLIEALAACELPTVQHLRRRARRQYRQKTVLEKHFTAVNKGDDLYSATPVTLHNLSCAAQGIELTLEVKGQNNHSFRLCQCFSSTAPGRPIPAPARASRPPSIDAGSRLAGV